MLAACVRHGRGWRRPAFDVARIEASAGRLLVHARQIVCGIRGHELVLGLEPHHLSLHCMNCGWRSPGWWIDGRRARYAGSRGTASNGDRVRARLRA